MDVEQVSLPQAVSNGTLRLLESRNRILGCLSETAPSEPPEEFDLEPGDRLVLNGWTRRGF